MSIFNFTNPVNGQLFEIKGPPGLSQEQAKAIFDKQVSSGSLVGFKKGDVLSAATQAAGGLAGAQSQLAQAAKGIGGDLTGAIKNIPGVGDIAAQAQSVASKTLSGISAAVSNLSVANGINVADFAKQGAALVPIQGLSIPDVTAAMASASKLVGQASSAISDTLGAGKFGFDASQLESVGVLKPGTAATYLKQGINSLTDVLKSPAVFTGKDGINNLDSLLGSVPTQNGIQQQLMSQGLNAVKQLGIPVDKLSTASLAGLANNAAKSIPTTLDWAKGLPLPADIKAQFDTAARDGAFAADFADFKVDDPMKAVITPLPAVDTTDRQTVDAASKRIVGNDKVPTVKYSVSNQINAQNESLALVKKLQTASKELNRIELQLVEIRKTVVSSNAADGIQILEDTLGELLLVDSQYLEYRRISDQLGKINPLYSVTAEIEKDVARLVGIRKRIEATIEKLREIIAQRTTA
jgi:hypothetical protein